jgi:ATP-dependent Clp protease ATP-binding subunit ClpA
MLSKQLETVLSSAVKEVKRRSHEYLTLEHLLYAVLLEESGRDILVNCGVNVIRLKHQLERFFIDHMETLPETPRWTWCRPWACSACSSGPSCRSSRRARRGARGRRAGRAVRGGRLLRRVFPEVPRRVAPGYPGIYRPRHGRGPGPRPGLGAAPGAPLPGQPGPGKAAEAPEAGPCSTSSPWTSPPAPSAARSTRSSAARRKSAARCRCFRAGARTTRSSWATPAWQDRPGRGPGPAHHQGDVPESFKDTPSSPWTWAPCWRAPSTAATSGPAQGRHQGTAGHPGLHPLRRRDPHHGRRRGHHRRHHGRLEHPEARAASGKLRCIGSTTYEEYKNHFEKDRALSRRFQKIDVAEPAWPIRWRS